MVYVFIVSYYISYIGIYPIFRASRHGPSPLRIGAGLVGAIYGAGKYAGHGAGKGSFDHDSRRF